MNSKRAGDVTMPSGVLAMPNAFDENDPPFDRLNPQEIETLRGALDGAKGQGSST
jgi:hypothetical protein